MTMVQTEPGRPQYASQNATTSCECGVALHGEALSLSSYWTLPPGGHSLFTLGAKTRRGDQASYLQNIRNPCPSQHSWRLSWWRLKLSLEWPAAGQGFGGELSSETQEGHGHVKGFREPASRSEPSLWDSAWCPQRHLHTCHSASGNR